MPPIMEMITPENVSMVFNIAFFVLIGFLALGFLVGLIRGVWKSGIRLIIVGGLVIAVFLGTRTLVDLLADFDVGGLINNFAPSFSSFSFTMGESLISVEVTTLRETIQSLVSQFVTASGLSSANAEATQEIILAFTLVILRYIAFIVFGIAAVTVGELLATILYFFPLRLFIPRNWRKKHKLRLIGGLLNTVKVFLVGALLITPFSSILNTINQAFQNDKNAVSEIDDPTYLKIMSFLNAYNDSLLSQVMFNWSVDQNGKTLDVRLIESITQEKIGEYNLSLTNELYVLAGIANTVLSTGILDQGLDTSLKINALLTEDIVSSIITNLASSSLLLSVIPIAVQFAVNLDAVKNVVDPDKLNLENISWEDELLNVRDIAVDVINAEVIPAILEMDEATFASVVPVLIGDGAYNHIHSALLKIDNSEFLSQVVPAVLYQLTQNEISEGGLQEGEIGLSTFLPSDWEEFKAIKLGEELALVYDVFYQLANIDPELVPALLGMLNQEEGAHGPLGRKTSSIPPFYQSGIDELTDILKEHIDDVIAVFVGQLDSNGDPINLSLETGKTILVDGSGNPIPNRHANLLDSELLIRGLDGLMRFALTPPLEGLMGEGGDLSKIDEAFDILNGSDFKDRRINYKKEFGSILGIFGLFFTNDDLSPIRDLIMPSEENGEEPAKNGKIRPLRADEGDDLFALFDNPALRRAFKTEISPRLDKSILMGKIIPSLLKSVVTNNAASFTDQIGLDVDDLNFEFTDVGTQMSIMVDLIGYASGIMSNLDTIFDDITPSVNSLIGMLDSLWTSNIINPKDQDGIPLSDNYFNIYDKVFSMIESIGVSSADLRGAYDKVSHTGWTTTFDEDGNVVGNPGENYGLIKFVETVLNTGLLDLSSDDGDILGQMVDLAKDSEDPLGRIFSSVDQSIIMADIFGGVLDNFFGATGGLIDSGLGTSFKNVDNWAEEGNNLKQLVIDLDEFTEDMNDIDFLNSDPVKVGNILKGLARSQIFNVGDDYKFGKFLKNKFVNDASVGGDLFFDPDEDIHSLSPYDIFDEDLNSVGDKVVNKENWYGDDGEIDKIVDFLAELNTFSGGSSDIFADLTDDPNLDLDGLRNVLLSLNEVSSLRIMLYNIYDKIFGTDQFAMSGLDMGDSNYVIFTEIDKLSRADEINATFDMYDSISELGLNGGSGTFDITTIDNSEIASIEELLNTLHESKLFNTFDEFHSKSRLAGNFTVFEQTVKMIYETSTINTYIYEGMSEAAMKTALNEDVVAINNNLTITGDPDGWGGPNGEIKAIRNIFQAFKDTDLSFDDFSGSGAEDVISDLFDTPAGTGKIKSLFQNLNESKIAYPSVPNLFKKVFDAADVGVSGIDLSKAHTHYKGNRGDQNIDDMYKPYDNGEIDNLMDIIGDMKKMVGKSYNDLTLLTDNDITDFEDLVSLMNQSEVFHQAGSSSLDPDDATVFEQMMVKILDDISLSSLIDDHNNPNPEYYHLNVYKFASAHEKSTYLVTKFDTLYSVNSSYYTHTWAKEIEHFFRNIREMKRLGLADGSFSPTSMSPEDLSFTLGALNYSNLTSDAVPSLLKTAFTNISFDEYTENYENYYLGPKGLMEKDLSTVDYIPLTPEIDEVGLIEKLLNDFYDGSNYLDMTTFDIVDYLDTHSSYSLFDLLENSVIFGSEIPLEAYKTRALIFYNLLDKVTLSKYLNLDNPTPSKKSRAERVEDIFKGDFDLDFEAERFDSFLKILDDLKTKDDASDINGLGTQFKAIIENTYELDLGDNIVDRAYLVSELAAGFYTDIFEEEYAKVTPTPATINFYTSDYGNLNPKEAFGIYGSLSVINEISLMLPDLPNPHQNNLDNLDSYFKYMGSLVNNQVTGGPHPTPYDYSLWDSEGNSLIAKLFYAAEIVTHASWTSFLVVVNNSSMLNHGVPTVLEDDPYSTNFVFEVLGKQISYAFES